MRQKCVYKVTSETEDKIPVSNFTQWFNYVLEFMYSCYDGKRFNKQCADKQMQAVGIDPIAV